MTTGQQSRLSGQTQTAGILAADTPRLADPGTGDVVPPRSRCCRCSHPLTSPRSVARAYGPHCWQRTVIGQLDARRDAVGRTLNALARRVARLEAPALAIVSAAMQDAVETLRAGGVR